MFQVQLIDESGTKFNIHQYARVPVVGDLLEARTENEQRLFSVKSVVLPSAGKIAAIVTVELQGDSPRKRGPTAREKLDAAADLGTKKGKARKPGSGTKPSQKNLRLTAARRKKDR